MAVLRGSHRVEPCAGAVRRECRSVEIADLDVIFLGRSGDPANGINVVSGKMLLQQLEDTARMLEARFAARLALGVDRERPLRFIVFTGFRVVAGEQTFAEVVVLA